ncbi:MAG: hypothetical protein ACR2KP_03180 [Egibacteraceae bacterium]|jgi:hypothetical protein
MGTDVQRMTEQTPTSPSAALSLLELRRHLLRRASALSVRAQRCRHRGDGAGAARLASEASRLARIAKRMGDDNND